MVLPTSYTFSSSLLKTDRQPLASGSSGDIYEGTLNGSKVCVKRIRIYTKEGPEKSTKVQYRHHLLPYPQMLTRLTDPIPGGCGVETLDTPKHRPPPWDDFRSSPARFRMGFRWGSDGVHQEVP